MAVDRVDDGSPVGEGVGASVGDSGGSKGGSVESLPLWAQGMIRDLRQEAGRHRQVAQEVREELEGVRRELEGARGLVLERQRGDALAGVEGLMADPGDLGRFVDLDGLVGEDGAPDVEAYRRAAEELVRERPHLGRRPRSSGIEMSGPVSVSRRDREEEGRERFVGLIQGD